MRLTTSTLSILSEKEPFESLEMSRTASISLPSCRVCFSENCSLVPASAILSTAFGNSDISSENRTSTRGIGEFAHAPSAWGIESQYGTYGLISRTGVPSTKSPPEISISTRRSKTRSSSNFTTDKPIGFGRSGERVASTPRRSTPPRRGGLTVGLHSCALRRWNRKITQR